MHGFQLQEIIELKAIPVISFNIRMNKARILTDI
jgi:hypothetical protein